MRAWEFFRAEHPRSPLRLTIAGTGPLADRVRSWAARDDQVDYLGLVPRTEARAIVAGGIAAVVPSAWEETFGMVAVEAMAAGVPPVAPATGSFPELIDHDVDGVLFSGGFSALARVFARIDTEPQHFVDLGHRAEQTYRARFQPKANLDQLLGIYEYAVRFPRAVA